MSRTHLSGQRMLGAKMVQDRVRPDRSDQQHRTTLRQLAALEELRAHLLALALRAAGHRTLAESEGEEKLEVLYRACAQEELEFARRIEDRIRNVWGTVPADEQPIPEALGFAPEPVGEDSLGMLAADVSDFREQLFRFRQAAEAEAWDPASAALLSEIRATLEGQISNLREAYFAGRVSRSEEVSTLSN